MADQSSQIFGLTNVMTKRLVLVPGIWFRLSFSIGQPKLLVAR